MTVTPGYPSGTYNYGTPPNGPALIELLVEVMERCGKIGVELTSQIIQSGRRSMNLVLSSWSNKGINLWTVAEFKQYMPQGVGNYVCLPQIVNVLADSIVLRQYQMGSPSAVTPDFTTTAGSTLVTVGNLPATPSAGQYIEVGVMTSVGGIVLDGFYQVVSVPGSNQATINAASPATSSTSGGNVGLWGFGIWGQSLWGGASVGGGVVPQFVTTAGSSTVTVNFPNHGLLGGQTFNVEVSTSVGGLSLLGPYTVNPTPTANQFTFTTPYVAGFSASVYENNGLTNLATQATIQGLTQTAFPVDIILYPISRGDWEAIPVKDYQGRPTSVWIDRQISPAIHVWPKPDANGPYELRFRASQQVQDLDIVSGQSIAVPQRFLEAFVSAFAAAMAVKFAPERLQRLTALADKEWQLASDEDSEKVSLFLGGDVSVYFE